MKATLKAASRRDTCPNLSLLTSHTSRANPSTSPRSSVSGLSGGLRIAVKNRVAGAGVWLHSGEFLGNLNEALIRHNCSHCSVDAFPVSERPGLNLMRLECGASGGAFIIKQSWMSRVSEIIICLSAIKCATFVSPTTNKVCLGSKAPMISSVLFYHASYLDQNFKSSRGTYSFRVHNLSLNLRS